MNDKMVWPKTIFFLFVALLLGVGAGRTEEALAPPPPVTAHPLQPPLNGWRKTCWPQWHAKQVETAKAGGIEVAFLGDSITHLWSDTEVGGGKYAHGLKVWERTFGHLKPGNFGIAGDRTQHLLWRLRNGLMEGFKAHPPKLFVVLIGTNNQEDGAGEVAEGIRAILDEIRQNLASRIILLAIFPRGSPSDPLRAKNQTVNEKLRGMADGERVRFLDLGPRFLEADGRLSPGIMTDGLHLSEKGYERWAEGLLPVVREMLGSPKP